MKTLFDDSFGHARCSECLRQGTLHINMATYVFNCTYCGADYLNPYAIGPWESKNTILDNLGGDVVSSYTVEDKEPKLGEDELNISYLLFMKYLYDKGKIKM